jgi:nitroimidazol reductase NimA-like FMN-containing flavoprotein (pyridoxamine 5'-phosphate oxidase superfamily)
MLMDGRTGIEVIDRDECLALLAAESVGRIAVIAGAEPVIFPVNYAMDGETIVFRTAVGSKFAAAVRGTRVSFEIDRFDPSARSGWSVVAVGPAEEVTGSRVIARMEAEIDLRPWADGERDHWMVITPRRLSGRRVRPSSR